MNPLTVIFFKNTCQDLGSNQKLLDLRPNALPTVRSRYVAVTYKSLYESDMILKTLELNFKLYYSCCTWVKKDISDMLNLFEHFFQCLEEKLIEKLSLVRRIVLNF